MSSKKREIEHFVAPLEETPLQAVDSTISDTAPASLWTDAWHSLRKKPLFLISAFLILLIALVSLFPQLFSPLDPTSFTACDLSHSLEGPSAGHILGYNKQGCDIYSRVIYGTRASVSVGILSTIGVVLLGGILGALAGFFGGWLDSIIARLGDIFFALPLILGALVVAQLPYFQENPGILSVVFILVAFGWPNIARITRGAIIEVKHADFITASTSLGVSRFGSLIKHAIPNALAPIIVVATISLGTFIVAEATLSFLSIGLPGSMMSWGKDISDAQSLLRTNPEVLIYPAVALSVTVLSFIMLGDAVKDALDPKARKQ
ncbi:oligopeptide transport system permease protein [Psychromicrobium silvestre]|uniref:Oligopeptide transport system permease protein n=1 Tax=Psychromicrobium silvestre TaxID=1645614 RepID=A0A7Y9S5T9_9MICC|nr:ABC transporter permease [Psychromicrobium silvestre]NYE95088.1 oligopeptide transport system permease protein [Psychromicrobium silvestre]